MKLVKVKIENFRSVEDSTEFEVDDVTCLVGKNEAGKTAILQALEAVRPYDESKAQYDKTRDYPRRFLNDYDDRHNDQEARVATTTWKLDKSDKNALEEEFGKDFVTGDEVEITKCYESDTTNWQLPVDPQKAILHLVSLQRFNATEGNCVKNSNNTQAAYNALQALENKTEKQQALIGKIEEYRKHSANLAAIDILAPLAPKFLYFSHYDRMSGQVSIEKLKNDRQNKTLSDEDRVFLDFLEYAGTTLDEISSATTFEDLNSRCEGASNKITDQIFEYWTQNPYLEIEVLVTKAESNDPAPFNQGIISRARVKNTLHRVTVPFSERSAGFIWFFSFLVKFAQVKKEFGNVIILLDEPGLTLHGKAQADLLRYFDEQLKPDHQIIYSTHSPFMVPADDLSSVRIVEDVIKDKKSLRPIPNGTKVSADVLATDPDTLFPLQGALGYAITQSLFIGEYTLLVEGPSHILYLKAASAALQRRGQTSLDPRWVVCPSGGIDKVMPFVSLFSGNQLHIAVLTDFAHGQKKKVENMKRSNLLREGHVYTVADFCGQDEADVEDLLDKDLFTDIINNAYQLKEKNALTATKLADADKHTVRQVLQAEAYFNLLPEEIPVFDHFTPASWLIENPCLLDKKEKKINDSLSRFEEIFKILNGLLEDK
jgi:predicted ATP-dependent endonuclease of OLD family